MPSVLFFCLSLSLCLSLLTRVPNSLHNLTIIRCNLKCALLRVIMRERTWLPFFTLIIHPRVLFIYFLNILTELHFAFFHCLLLFSVLLFFHVKIFVFPLICHTVETLKLLHYWRWCSTVFKISLIAILVSVRENLKGGKKWDDVECLNIRTECDENLLITAWNKRVPLISICVIKSGTDWLSR